MIKICTPLQLRGTAKMLYDSGAKNAPIYDYHCHLSPKEIYEDIQFNNIADMMLIGDHYKWRAMRYMGISETIITGNGSPKEKFLAWSKTCAQLAGSPLYYWSHLEMKLFFGVDDQLCSANAEENFAYCNSIIVEHEYSPRKIIERMNVKLICTTDDPCDSLEYHKKLSTVQNLPFRVLPTFRPDKAMKPIDSGFKDYVSRLALIRGTEIRTIQNLLDALEMQLDHFVLHGCKFSDHSLESMEWISISDTEAGKIFEDSIQGRQITQNQNDSFCLYLLSKLGAMYSKRNIAMQLHIGALRNTNSITLEQLGRDAGFDIVNDFNVAIPLAMLLDTIEKTGGLPRTILYALNAKDYPILASICPCFTCEAVLGKVQIGSAWWHCDTKTGVLEQIQCAADYGLLSQSWGMVTDSRNFLSYARHHYFRLILCDYLGAMFDCGEYFGTKDSLLNLVECISYKNVKDNIFS